MHVRNIKVEQVPVHIDFNDGVLTEFCFDASKQIATLGFVYIGERDHCQAKWHIGLFVTEYRNAGYNRKILLNDRLVAVRNPRQVSETELKSLLHRGTDPSSEFIEIRQSTNAGVAVPWRKLYFDSVPQIA